MTARLASTARSRSDELADTNPSDLGRVFKYIDDLRHAAAVAENVAESLKRAVWQEPGERGTQSEGPPSRSVGGARLLAAAYYLLPADDQVRYAEQYRSEL